MVSQNQQLHGLKEMVIVFLSACHLSTYIKRNEILLGEDFDYSDEITQNNRNIQVLTNGTLKIEHTSSENIGHYFCQVSNGVGNELSQVVTVKVFGQ